MPIRRSGRQSAVIALRQGLAAGLKPEDVLATLRIGRHSAMWQLLLDAILRLEHGLVRRGNELWGDCDACGGHDTFSVGKLRARCANCGIDMASEVYIRLQLERKNGIGKAFR